MDPFVSLSLIWIQAEAVGSPIAHPNPIDSQEEGSDGAFTYLSGYKYQLHKDYEYLLNFDTKAEAVLNKIEIKGNRMILRKGYGWDGASGPAIDTKNFMRGSAIHDALYVLMAHGVLEQEEFKDHCDQEFMRILAKDGMPRLRRMYVYQAVKQFGIKGSSKRGIKEIRFSSQRTKLKRAFQAIALALK
ncbi:MAG: hypothetical protein ACI92G_001326 [Candidatus Pelagisphaera sp.]